MNENQSIKGFRKAVKIAKRWENHNDLRSPSPDLTLKTEAAEFILGELDFAIEVLQYYAGNFNGRDGTRWHGDTFFAETKFGTTESVNGPVAAKAALKRFGIE